MVVEAVAPRGDDDEAGEEEEVVAVVVVGEVIVPPPVATCRIRANVERSRLVL